MITCANWARAVKLQWGRSLSAAEWPGAAPAGTREIRLQWGRSLSAAECALCQAVLKMVEALQWGRSLSAAECSRCHRWRRSGCPRFNGAAAFRLRNGRNDAGGSLLDLLASMGPQPFGCGMDVMTRAVPFWIFLLQWGRSLSAAEWRSPPAGCSRNGICFNGAAAFRLRNGHLAFWEDSGYPASMGPQPFGCGMLGHNPQALACRSASMGPQPFGCGMNGVRDQVLIALRASMGPQPFGCGMGGVLEFRRILVARFNGAAAFRLRNVCLFFAAGTMQKSFNGAAAFRLRNVRPASGGLWRGDRASMGPQPFGCGMRKNPRKSGGGLLSFNGAAAFRLRNVASSHSCIVPADTLQWGRSLSAAE